MKIMQDSFVTCRTVIRLVEVRGAVRKWRGPVKSGEFFICIVSVTLLVAGFRGKNFLLFPLRNLLDKEKREREKRKQNNRNGRAKAKIFKEGNMFKLYAEFRSWMTESMERAKNPLFLIFTCSTHLYGFSLYLHFSFPPL